MYKTQEQLSDIDVGRPANSDHAKAMQHATSLKKEGYGYEGLQMTPSEAMQSALKSQIGGSHYKDMVLQPIEFIERNKLSFSAGNVIKYVCRADKKGGVEDLQKAKHYIELMIEMAGK